jgi:uncharacterized repeat protein (TIGR03803 family)
MKYATTLLFACLTIPAFAASPKTAILYNFKGSPDGEIPEGTLTADATGNLYGAAQGGYTSCGSGFGCGTVFALIAPASQGGAWTEQVLHRFTGGPDGGVPYPLAMDSHGNLYGIGAIGGDGNNAYCASLGFSGCGVVFELSQQKGVWTETVLHTFEGPDGAEPRSPLIFDAHGNLYGSTEDGGANGGGIVFEMSPNGDGTWAEVVLYNFANPSSQEVSSPLREMVFDSQGNLYGTASIEDGNGNADYVIYQLQAGTWQETTIYMFGAQYAPNGLAIDKTGNLYGTTNGGVVINDRCPNGCGTIFELSPADGLWNYATLFEFFDGQGTSYGPTAPPLLDSAGNLYGTTEVGGGGCGSVWRLTPSSGAWAELDYQLSHNPPGLCQPNGTPIFGKFGGLYSASMAGGPYKNRCFHGCGTVFAIYP